MPPPPQNGQFHKEFLFRQETLLRRHIWEQIQNPLG
jgi:hypothetical protein